MALTSAQITQTGSAIEITAGATTITNYRTPGRYYISATVDTYLGPTSGVLTTTGLLVKANLQPFEILLYRGDRLYCIGASGVVTVLKQAN